MTAGAKYLLRRWLAGPAQRLAWLFPRSETLGRIADRLTFVRSVYGPFLRNTPGDRTFELCVSGYGRFVADAIASQEGRFVFLDIGANLGLFSLLAARSPGCERAIAFEPADPIFRNLVANLRRNAAGKVEPIHGAVSPSPDPFVHLSFNPTHSGLSKIVRGGSGGLRVPVLSADRLDELFDEIPPAIVAKIDVEGSENEVLSVLRWTRFYGAIREIIIEVSEDNLGSAGRERLLGLLAEDGYVELSRSGSPQHYDARYRRRS